MVQIIFKKLFTLLRALRFAFVLYLSSMHAAEAVDISSLNCTSNCSTATSASTVQWTLIFKSSVSGVTASNFSLSSSGLTGAFVSSVTGSGTIWIITANTGIGSGTLQLTFSNANGISPTVGASSLNTAQTYASIAAPELAEYRMDESSWTGAAGQVADSSGNGNNAQAMNSASTAGTTPAIATNPGTCNYGIFNNGGTITQGYVLTPLPNLTTDFTITAWIRTTNNTVQGQRILIDDQNNTGGYGFSLGDGGAGALRFFSRNVTPVILDSTYTIASNTWYFVAAVSDIANHMRTIYVFNQSGVLKNVTTESAWTGAWGTDIGPVSIGGETNASAESSYHFNGNLDEVRVYQSALSQTALAAIATQTHPCSGGIPNHLEIQSAASGLTCAANTLTIKACSDAAVPCIVPYISGVSGTLSATGVPTVSWDGTTGGAAGAGFVIPNGSSSVTKNALVSTAGSVLFGITSPSPVPAAATACNFGSPSCTFTASTAGFIFSNSDTGSSNAIPNMVSGTSSSGLYLRALQTATNNPAVCTPAIINQNNIAVTMGYACNNPVACQSGNLATINTAVIAPAGTSVSLNFDGNGSAPITVQYNDVGQITLNASKTLTPVTGATTTLNSNSNAFVVAPHHFGISAVTAGPIKAGNNFSATLTAYNALSVATPNFGHETSPEGATVAFNKCQPTGSSSSSGLFSSGTIPGFTSGVATATSLNWSEVGNGDLIATLASGNYLGSGYTTTGNTGTSGTVCNAAGNVGRFIPDHFDTAVINGCGSCGFTYSGEPFTVLITAKNGLSTPTVTVNYDGTANTSPNFAKAMTLSAWDAATGAIQNPGPGSLLPPALTSLALTNFTQGLLSLSTTMPFYTFTTSPTVPTLIRLRAIDSDNVTSLRTPLSSSIEGQTQITSGRIQLLSEYGSELLPLSFTATAQYYSSYGWTNSITDSSSHFVVATPSATSDISFGNYLNNLSTISVTSSPKTVTLAYGTGSFSLAAPGANKTGSVDMSIPLLSGTNCYITPTPVGCYLSSSTARATFGIYQGTSIFIYHGRQGH